MFGKLIEKPLSLDVSLFCRNITYKLNSIRQRVFFSARKINYTIVKLLQNVKQVRPNVKCAHLPEVLFSLLHRTSRLPKFNNFP